MPPFARARAWGQTQRRVRHLSQVIGRNLSGRGPASADVGTAFSLHEVVADQPLGTKRRACSAGRARFARAETIRAHWARDAAVTAPAYYTSEVFRSAAHPSWRPFTAAAFPADVDTASPNIHSERGR